MNFPHLIKEPQFARGLYLSILILLLELMVQFMLKPTQHVSYIMTFSTLVGLLLLGLVLTQSHRLLGIGILVGWVIFIALPVAYVFFISGFRGMNP